MSERIRHYNHSGLCVTDLARAQAFYENVLGFKFWFSLDDLPDEAVGKLSQLTPPIGLKAVYLVLDGMVLELLGYRPGLARPPVRRTMIDPGLTHLSITVDDLDEACEAAVRYGGEVLQDSRVAAAVMLRDPDGSIVELLLPRFRASRPPWPMPA